MTATSVDSAKQRKHLSSSALNSRRGMLLPLVLILILGMASSSLSVLGLVSSERLLEQGELAHLRLRAEAEALMAKRDSTSPPDGLTLEEISLGDSFVLRQVVAVAGGPSFSSVLWVLDPERILAGLPAALQVSGPPPDEGVMPLEGCASAQNRPLVAEPGHGQPPSSGNNALPPRLGPLGIEELGNLADVLLASFTDLPGRTPPAVRKASPETVITGGSGAGVLVAEGDLTLEGSAEHVGLIVTAGHLTLRHSARVEGVALVGGSIQILDGAGISGCPESARQGLELSQLSRAHALPAGWLLGRY